jgi:hypothetical protein
MAIPSPAALAPAALPAASASRPAFDRRRIELALTVLTLALVVSSALAERVGLPVGMHRALDLAAYLAGGWFAVAETLPRLRHGGTVFVQG